MDTDDIVLQFFFHFVSVTLTHEAHFLQQATAGVNSSAQIEAAAQRGILLSHFLDALLGADVAALYYESLGARVLLLACLRSESR